MTIDDIKVGQTWVWYAGDTHFIIVDIKDNNITWMAVNNGVIIPNSKYGIERLLEDYNNGYCRLISESAPKVRYNMDKFKFI